MNHIRVCKKAFIIVVFSFLIVLTACVFDPASFSFEKETLLQTLSSVQLINYDSTSEVVSNTEEIEDFDFEKVKILSSLPDDKYEDFCESLSEIYFIVADGLRYFNTSACGKSLLLKFKNGNFIVLSDNHEVYSFVAEFGSDGKREELLLFFEDSTTCQMLIETYFHNTN